MLACENIRFSSLSAAGYGLTGDVSRGATSATQRQRSPRETSPAAKSEEKRMFSQAIPIQILIFRRLRMLRNNAILADAHTLEVGRSVIKNLKILFSESQQYRQQRSQRTWKMTIAFIALSGSRFWSRQIFNTKRT